MSSQPQLKKVRKTLFSYYRKESKGQSTSETNSSSNINVPIPDMFHNSKFQNLTSLSELCRRLVETGKVSIYFLIDRLVRLVLTLPISTATTERAMSKIG